MILFSRKYYPYRFFFALQRGFSIAKSEDIKTLSFGTVKNFIQGTHYYLSKVDTDVKKIGIIPYSFQYTFK